MTVEQPYNLDGEEALLGALLASSDWLPEVQQILDPQYPDHFYSRKNRVVYDAMNALYANGVDIDIITVTDYLDRHKQLQAIGGQAYLTGLATTVLITTSENVLSYARLVQDAARRRRLIVAAEEVAKRAFDESLEIDQIEDLANHSFQQLAQTRPGSFLVSAREAADEYYEYVREGSEHPITERVIPTGLADLDALMVGLWRGNLIIVGGRTGEGKTALLDTFIQTALGKHQRVLLYSGEMPPVQRLQRYMAMLAPDETTLDSHKLRMGRGLTDQDWSDIVSGVTRMSEAPITYLTSGSLSELRRAVIHLRRNGGLDLVAIDYLGLMSADLGKNAMRSEQVAHLARSLKNIAMQYNVAVVAAAQFNREVRAGTKPTKFHLKDSSEIEQAADDILLIHHEGEDDPQHICVTRDIIVDKQRNGPVGEVTAAFHKKRTMFVDPVIMTLE